jgi:flagellar hook-length control protein FliK
MMNMDITAVSAAAPPSDASCGSADASAGESNAFAALLDEAAGAADEQATPSDDEHADEEDTFDEMAALSMGCMLAIGAAPPTDPAVDDSATASAHESGDEITEIGGVAAGESSEVATSAIPGETNTAVTPEEMPLAASGTDVSATAVEETDAPADVPQGAVTPEAPSEGKALTPDPASTGKIDAEAKPVKGRASAKAARSDQAKSAHATTPAGMESIQQDQSVKSETIDATAGSERTQAPARAAASTASRLAKALERAVAIAGGEQNNTQAVAADTSTGDPGQESAFGESTSNRAAQFLAAVRHAASNGVAFTVAAPATLDAKVFAAVPGHGPEMSGVEIPERDVVAQLVQSLRVQFRDGIGEAVVKLRPEHLGTVQVSIRIENGAIKATIQAEVPAVRQWLESQQDTLRSGLADQGLRLDRFVVEPDGRQSQSDDAHQQREQRRKQHQKQQMSEKDHPVFEVTV